MRIASRSAASADEPPSYSWVEPRERGGVEFFSVGENSLFSFKSFVFAGDEMGGFDFFLLITPEIDHAQAVLLAVEKIIEFCGRSVPMGVSLTDRI
ncbi:MAG: hypothetical protein WDM87_13360 [Terracidiphilus sp.]